MSVINSNYLNIINNYQRQDKQNDGLNPNNNKVNKKLSLNNVSKTNLGLLKAYYANSYNVGLNPQKKVNLIFKGTPVESINNAFTLTTSGRSKLKKYDGGYVVDDITKTTVYYGTDAKKFLDNRTYFPNETQIIAPSSTSLKINIEGQGDYTLSEPGAILIKKGSFAKINVEKGSPLILTTEQDPGWYSKFSASDKSHKDFFEVLVEKNRFIQDYCFTKESVKDDFDKLKSKGIIEEYDCKYAKFSDDLSFEDLQDKLNKIDFKKDKQEKIDQIEKLYKQTESAKSLNKSSEQNSGEVKQEDFNKCVDKSVFEKMKAVGILKQDNEKILWGQLYKEDELKADIEKKIGKSKDTDQILHVWEKTTRSGYDTTGLSFLCDGVAVYKYNDKVNQHNLKPTEWITNSTVWGNGECPSVGVSRVVNNLSGGEARDFNKIRPEEAIHKHVNPNDSSETQAEAYVITSGKAAFVVLDDNRKQMIQTLNEGELGVISPGLEHGIIAIKGDYEHLCFQCPSAFHYGFRFKNIVGYFNDKEFEGLNEEGVKKLKEK